MALQSVGLYTHIRNNNITSALLLLMFPMILLIIVWVVGFGAHIYQDTRVSGAYPEYGLQSSAEFAKSVEAGFNAVMNYGLVALGAALVWVGIAAMFHENMINAATGARTISKSEYPELYNLLENLCISRGLQISKLGIIETDALNAFASGISDKSYRITVTRGLLETLDKNELEAVLGHELTHIINKDVRLLIVSTVFVGMLAFFSEMLWRSLRSSGRARSGNGKSKGGALILIAAIAVGIGYLTSILVRFSLSRTREFLADAGSVELTKNPGAMASALMKISGHAEIGKVPEEVMEMFIENPPSFFGLFSTHPPIVKRIEALKLMGSISYTPGEPLYKNASGGYDYTGYDVLKKMSQKEPAVAEAAGPWAAPVAAASNVESVESTPVFSVGMDTEIDNSPAIFSDNEVAFRDSVDPANPDLHPQTSFTKSPFIMIAIVMILVGGGFMFGGFFGYVTEKAYQINGEITSGTVENTWTSHSNKSTTYHVKYRFHDENGVSRTGSSTVSRSLWGALSRGSQAKVQYVKGADTNRIAGSGLGISGAFALGAFGAALLIGAIYLPFSFVRREDSFKVLTSSGAMVIGRVTKVDSSKMSINKVPYSRIAYEYKDHLGATHSGKTRYLRLSLADDFKIGAKIRVWYNSSKPSENISEIG